MSIGQRIYEAIRARAKEKGIKICEEIKLLGVSKDTARNWRIAKHDPGAWIIAEMCRQGYDIAWILTGDESR